MNPLCFFNPHCRARYLCRSAHWMGARIQVRYYDPSVDPVSPAMRAENLHLLARRYILFPLYLRHNNLTMLLSRHRDETFTRTATWALNSCVAHRGGMAACGGIARSQRMNLTITPTAAARRAPVRTVYWLKLGLPIVAMGFGYDRPGDWHLGFSRDSTHAGPSGISPAIRSLGPRRDGIEHYRLQVERLLNPLKRKPGRRALKVEEVPLRRTRWRDFAAHCRTPVPFLPQP